MKPNKPQHSNMSLSKPLLLLKRFRIRLRQKNVLASTSCRVLFCLMMLVQSNYSFAGGPATGGSSEWTQILNWAELVEQKTTQAALLVNSISSLDVLIRNATQNPLGLLPKSALTRSLLKTLNNLQDIGNDMSEIDARWSHAYLDPPDGRTSSKFRLSNDKSMMAAKGALQAIIKQQEEFDKSVEAIDALKLKLKLPAGTNGHLAVLTEATLSAAEIAANILRALQSQSTTLATYVAGETAKDQTTRDINEKAVSFKKEERVLTKKEHKLSQFITAPEPDVLGK